MSKVINHEKKRQPVLNRFRDSIINQAGREFLATAAVETLPPPGYPLGHRERFSIFRIGTHTISGRLPRANVTTGLIMAAIAAARELTHSLRQKWAREV